MRKSTMVSLLICSFLMSNNPADAWTHNIVLGRPTNQSITASVMFDTVAVFYLEYGTQSGLYSAQTPVFNAQSNTPEEVEISGLSGDTKYYYRLRYSVSSSTPNTTGAEHIFHTQRSPGQGFTFTVEADEHLYDKKGVASLYHLTLANQLADNPDFMLSLGDIFGDDHEPFTITSSALDTLHRDYRPFLGEICHSVPFYVCLGNHEGENDYYQSINPPYNLCYYGTQWRKFYYPNPFPNNFYSGNTTIEPYGIGYPENYFAWTWGDALFVVLDVYRDQNDTAAKPQGWNWSLGDPQYFWLKNTLESSNSTYKFVFAHHIRGQGRGGIIPAYLYEWGGYQNANGNYTFPIRRPNWPKPIHRLFVDNGVNIFFQGHDHLYAREVMDNVVYQEVPMAADSTYEIGMLANASAYTADTLPGSGHLRVNVQPSCITVDFIRAYLPADTLGGMHQNGENAFSYTIGNCLPTEVKNTSQIFEPGVYPIPAKETLYIQYPLRDNQTALAGLYDINGKLISSVNIMKDFYATPLDISSTAPGIYVLKILAGNYTYTKKVVITK